MQRKQDCFISKEIKILALSEDPKIGLLNGRDFYFSQSMRIME